MILVSEFSSSLYGIQFCVIGIHKIRILDQPISLFVSEQRFWNSGVFGNLKLGFGIQQSISNSSHGIEVPKYTLQCELVEN